MSKYIEVKLVEAEPETDSDFYLRHLSMLNHNTKDTPGYTIKDPDGYKESWVETDDFKKRHLKLIGDTNYPSKINVGKDAVYDFIDKIDVKTIGDKTTFVMVTLVNGFEITETASCVDAKNYSEAGGKAICMQKIGNKILELLGFLLQTAWKGFDADEKD